MNTHLCGEVRALAAGALASLAAASIAHAAPCAPQSGASNETPQERIVLDATVSTLTPVAEPDWLEVLTVRVDEADRLGLFARETRNTRDRLARHMRRPVELALPRSLKESVHFVQLMTKNQWLAATDEQRQALESLRRAYLFVDASDAAQLVWLKTEWPAIRLGRTGTLPVRVVAVGGDLHELARAAGARVWADQGGRLSRAFALTAVPALALVHAQADAPGNPAGVAGTVTAFAVKDDNEMGDGHSTSARSPRTHREAP